MVERCNKTLIQMLTNFVSSEENYRDWNDHLPFVMAAYKATEHSSTCCTPNLLMLGRNIEYPIDLMVGPPPGQNDTYCPIEYVEWFKSSTRKAFLFANDQLGISATRQKRYYDRGLKPREFSSGDWVWRWYPPTANKKLALGWTGPYLVTEKLTYLTYRIQKSKDSNPIVVHIDHLKPYEGSQVTGNWLSNRPTIDTNISICNDATDLAHNVNYDNGDVTNETDDVINEDTSTTVPFVPRTRRERIVKPRQIYSPS
jgi:hypothetical protein